MTSSLVLPIPLVYQGHRGYCLYTCTSMMLQYFGIKRTPDQVAEEVFLPVPSNGEEIAETASSLAAYLRWFGLDVQVLGPGSFDMLRDSVDRLNPAILAVKNDPADTLPNHAWVLRGYVQPASIVFNNPQRDPANAYPPSDPITLDWDGDGQPGETQDYSTFERERWQNIPGSDRMYLPVSYRGGGPGRDWLLGWRLAGRKNGGKMYFYTARFTRDLWNMRPMRGGIDGFLASVSFAAMLPGLLQLAGQALENAGTNLINDGRTRWDKGGAGGRIVGGLEIVAGGILAGIGYVLDFSLGTGGEVVDIVMSGIETTFLPSSAGRATATATTSMGPNWTSNS